MIVRFSLDFTECDRARWARDAAYDGLFYTGVLYHGHLPSGLSSAPRLDFPVINGYLSIDRSPK